MKKIAVIGLGIIGGSICGALTRAGYTVDGFGRSEASVQFALQAGYIRAKGTDIADYDVVFIAVPPKATVDYLENGKFKDGALVTDITRKGGLCKKTQLSLRRHSSHGGKGNVRHCFGNVRSV